MWLFFCSLMTPWTCCAFLTNTAYMFRLPWIHCESEEQLHNIDRHCLMCVCLPLPRLGEVPGVFGADPAGSEDGVWRGHPGGAVSSAQAHQEEALCALLNTGGGDLGITPQGNVVSLLSDCVLMLSFPLYSYFVFYPCKSSPREDTCKKRKKKKIDSPHTSQHLWHQYRCWSLL